MKIVISPDSFKESMTALEAATAIKKGLEKIWLDAEYVLIPMADGGEGTVQSLVDCTNGFLLTETVSDPLGQPIKAHYGVSGDGQTAFIEMAQASGLELVPSAQRNPYHTSTFGTGELIIAALNKGIRRLLIGIGGSATNDAGAGMLMAVGARLLDAQNQPIAQGGLALEKLEHIDITDLDPRLAACEIIVACDVDNPLCGERGASAVFGPQKGATPEMVNVLDAALGRFANIVQRDLRRDIAQIAGAGAAGGLGAALAGVLGARLTPGIDMIIEATNLKAACAGASFVFTGEGRIDFQSAYGKTPVGVAKVAKVQGAKVIALVGCVGQGYEAVFEQGIDAVFPILPGLCTFAEAMQAGPANLERVAENIARGFLALETR